MGARGNANGIAHEQVMRLASVCKQRDPSGPDESGEERSAVDAAYSKWARPGGAFDEEGWIAYKSSLCPPVSDVDFVRNGGAELVLDKYVQWRRRF